MEGLRVIDSASQLDGAGGGKVVVCGSHGAFYAAWLAANARVRAAVLNDAGIGRHSAGIAGVAWLGGLGIAACSIDYRSARIGDGADMLANGIVSMTNDVAASHGCLPGHSCREVVTRLLDQAEDAPAEKIPEIGEPRLRIPKRGHREGWGLDPEWLHAAQGRP